MVYAIEPDLVRRAVRPARGVGFAVVRVDAIDQSVNAGLARARQRPQIETADDNAMIGAIVATGATEAVVLGGEGTSIPWRLSTGD